MIQPGSIMNGYRVQVLPHVTEGKRNKYTYK